MRALHVVEQNLFTYSLGKFSSAFGTYEIPSKKIEVVIMNNTSDKTIVILIILQWSQQPESKVFTV